MSRVWGNASGHPLCVVREMAEGKTDMDNLGNSEWFHWWFRNAKGIILKDKEDRGMGKHHSDGYKGLRPLFCLLTSTRECLSGTVLAMVLGRECPQQRYIALTGK